MTERFFILTPTPTDQQADGFPVYLDAEGKPMKWSGKFPIPAIGTTVNIRLNGIGLAEVKGYFESCGFVGVMTLPKNPPRWLVKQNREDCKDKRRPQWYREGIGCEFGNEIEVV